MNIDIVMSQKKCCTTTQAVDELHTTAHFLKIIAEENRLKILCLLKDGERCVCDIWPAVDLAQNLVSHHLKVLKDFQLITARKEGLKVFYSINKEKVSTYTYLLNQYLHSYGE